MIKKIFSNITNKLFPVENTKLVEIENVKAEIQDAINQRNVAWQFFEYAEKDYVDAAIYNLKAAEARLSMLYNDAKKSHTEFAT